MKILFSDRLSVISELNGYVGMKKQYIFYLVTRVIIEVTNLFVPYLYLQFINEVIGKKIWIYLC